MAISKRRWFLTSRVGLSPLEAIVADYREGQSVSGWLEIRLFAKGMFLVRLVPWQARRCGSKWPSVATFGFGRRGGVGVETRRGEASKYAAPRPVFGGEALVGRYLAMAPKS